MPHHIKHFASQGGKAVPREKRLWSRDPELAREMGKRGLAARKQRRKEREQKS